LDSNVINHSRPTDPAHGQEKHVHPPKYIKVSNPKHTNAYVKPEAMFITNVPGDGELLKYPGGSIAGGMQLT
jgi:hypothetical protein